MKDHYSSLDLDVAWLDGLAQHPTIAEHATNCDSCRAYLEGLSRLEEAAPEAAAERAPPRIVTPRSLRRNAWLTPVAATLALAAAALLFVRARPQVDDYVGTKGSPASQVLLRRDGATRVWDGHEAVRPRDALALQVTCEGFSHVTVAALAAGSPRRVSSNACGAPGATLPFTLVVDDAPGGEVLWVIFSVATLDETALVRATERGERSGAMWTTRIDLPKEEKP